MGFRYKCFLDAYKGYHQVQMAKEDEEKTAFYIDQGKFCYTKMPVQHIKDISETFDNLRRINIQLNPRKCSFEMEEGKFEGYMVTSEGIRANPKKSKALADMQSPRTLKEMECLSGKMVALNRFLARSAERSFPFFDTLKNITNENVRHYLTS
ncbi:hypothetical protein Tco_1577439 [Tanacetum coccineum]